MNIVKNKQKTKLNLFANNIYIYILITLTIVSILCSAIYFIFSNIYINNYYVALSDTSLFSFNNLNSATINANSVSVWDKYQSWFIAAFVVYPIYLILYIVGVIRDKVNLFEDFASIFSNFWFWFLWFPLFIFLLVLLFRFGVTEGIWIPFAIWGGGFGVLLIAIGIFHLIRKIIDNKKANNMLHHYKYYSDYTNPDNTNFNNWTKQELFDYCYYNSINFRQNDTKKTIVENIHNWYYGDEYDDTNDDNELQTTKSKKTNSDKINPLKKENKTNNKGILLDDIAGLDDAKKAFREKVILPITHAHLYKHFNKKTGGGILLYGLPGTGKTMFAEAVSNEIDAKFFSLKCSDIKSKWIGESEIRTKKLFNEARKEKRAIIFFDEFEAIGRKRSSNEDNASNDIVPEILAQIQGVGNDTSNILLIAATNRPWDIDSALLRPGRFDVKIHIPLPDFNARKKIFEMKLKDTLCDKLDLDYLSKITDGCNGADVADFVERLKMEAIHRSIKEDKALPINTDDVKNVLKSFKSSVINEDIKKISEFEFN